MMENPTQPPQPAAVAPVPSTATATLPTTPSSSSTSSTSSTSTTASSLSLPPLSSPAGSSPSATSAVLSGKLLPFQGSLPPFSTILPPPQLPSLQSPSAAITTLASSSSETALLAANQQQQQKAARSSSASPDRPSSQKPHVSKACNHCKKAHLACDAARPCYRCLSSGRADSCTDLEHKKRGRPRLRAEGATAGTAAATEEGAIVRVRSASSESEKEQQQQTPRTPKNPSTTTSTSATTTTTSSSSAGTLPSFPSPSSSSTSSSSSGLKYPQKQQSEETTTTTSNLALKSVPGIDRNTAAAAANLTAAAAAQAMGGLGHQKMGDRQSLPQFLPGTSLLPSLLSEFSTAPLSVTAIAAVAAAASKPKQGEETVMPATVDGSAEKKRQHGDGSQLSPKEKKPKHQKDGTQNGPSSLSASTLTAFQRMAPFIDQSKTYLSFHCVILHPALMLKEHFGVEPSHLYNLSLYDLVHEDELVKLSIFRRNTIALNGKSHQDHFALNLPGLTKPGHSLLDMKLLTLAPDLPPVFQCIISPMPSLSSPSTRSLEALSMAASHNFGNQGSSK